MTPPSPPFPSTQKLATGANPEVEQVAEHTKLDESASGDSALQIQQCVRLEQMRAIFESATLVSFATTLCALMLVWHLDNIVGLAGHSRSSIWLVIKCSIAVVRIVHNLMFSRRTSPSLAWLRWSGALLLVDGITWGAAPFALAPLSGASETALISSMCGVAAVTVLVTYADWRACVTFAASLFVPLISYLLWKPERFGLYTTGALLTFAAVLLAMARHAEQRVVELLTLRFTNKKLTDTLKLALDRKTSEGHSKDLFVANISHELRTPLHGILGLTRRLYATVPEHDHDILRMIRRSGEHLLLLINNVLEFSRFEAHGIDLHPTQVDLTRVLMDAVALCGTAASEKSIELCEALDLGEEGAPCTVTDPFRLQQVVINLVGNAIKFTPRGGRVNVSAHWATNDSFVMHVSDNGVGISEDALKNLFAPFVQVDRSRTRRHGGTGLGLYISREICQKLGGDISCVSKIDAGSTFEVRLPLTRITSADTPPQKNSKLAHLQTTPSSVAARPLAPPAHKAVVLVVEDNPVNALVATFALEHFGISVRSVQDGKAALDELCRPGHNLAMVLMDCRMPVMDGFTATAKIREYEILNQLAPLPIVALTANVLEEDQHECRAAGMSAFLPKPFSLEELRHVLVDWGLVAAGPDEASPSDNGAMSTTSEVDS